MKQLFMIFLSLLVLSGCAVSDEAHVTNQNYRVALIAKSDQSYFWQVVLAGAKSAAVEYGIIVDMYAPSTEDDYQTQIQMIENAVRENYDAILFSACDYNKTVPAIEAAIDGGVKVVTIDSGIGTKRNVLFIGTDNDGAGYKAGEALAQYVTGEMKVGIISFEEFSANGMQRVDGFTRFLQEQSNAELIDLRYCMSNREEPKQATLDMLASHPEINAVATFNEWTTLGVGDAIEEQNLGDKVAVVAFDNNVDSVSLLEKGMIDTLIVQNPFAMGYLGIEHAISQLQGEKPAETVIYTDSVAITADNMYTAQNQKLLFPFEPNKNAKSNNISN